MAYIASRPVRFDRSYAIGEIIPDSVIDPKMTARLTAMGRIIHIADRPAQNTPSDSAGDPTEGPKSEADILHEDRKEPPEAKSEAAEAKPVKAAKDKKTGKAASRARMHKK